MLQAGTKWSWSTKCEEAFQEAKKQIASAKVLTHYDPTLPIKLVADASTYGIGAVISHRMPDGSERPIAFASHTLTKSENNYAQLEKEALSLVYVVNKFIAVLLLRMHIEIRIAIRQRIHTTKELRTRLHLAKPPVA